jgi:hypothetical protein
MSIGNRGRTGAVVAIVGVFLLIAAPRIGERFSGEARAIGTLRAIGSAEAAYVSASGAFATPECLTSAVCAGGVFLEPALGHASERHGYQFHFLPGPGASPASISAYAVIAVPLAINANAPRSYCVDDRQTIYVIRGRAPRVEAGRCLDTDTPLR